jgi:hypothetical protein
MGRIDRQRLSAVKKLQELGPAWHQASGKRWQPMRSMLLAELPTRGELKVIEELVF